RRRWSRAGPATAPRPGRCGRSGRRCRAAGGAGSSPAPAPPPPRRGPAAALELRLARIPGRDAAQASQLRDQDFFGADTVPVVVVGAAEPAHELDDGVLVADLDVAMATGAAVELAGDAADQ